ncbi:MAG: hypothetical protein QOI76_3135 [Frankiales bacterium]|nr:hypothetical protein [Frankiales bacterium]
MGSWLVTALAVRQVSLVPLAAGGRYHSFGTVALVKAWLTSGVTAAYASSTGTSTRAVTTVTAVRPEIGARRKVRRPNDMSDPR